MAKLLRCIFFLLGVGFVGNDKRDKGTTKMQTQSIRLQKKVTCRAKILVAFILGGIIFVVFVLTQVISHYIDVLVGVGG